MDEKIIFTRWLAYELRVQGFKILRTEINRNNPKLICWVFKDTEAINKAIADLTRNRK